METRIYYLINQAQTNLKKVINKECIETTGISVVQNTALLALEKDDGCTLGDLGDVLNIGKSSLSTLAERMEGAGIIVREIDSYDARTTRVYLTDLGLEKLKLLKPLLRNQNKRLREGFSEAEMSVVVRFLNSAAKIKPMEI